MRQQTHDWPSGVSSLAVNRLDGYNIDLPESIDALKALDDLDDRDVIDAIPKRKRRTLDPLAVALGPLADVLDGLANRLPRGQPERRLAGVALDRADLHRLVGRSAAARGRSPRSPTTRRWVGHRHLGFDQRLTRLLDEEQRDLVAHLLAREARMSSTIVFALASSTTSPATNSPRGLTSASTLTVCPSKAPHPRRRLGLAILRGVPDVVVSPAFELRAAVVDRLPTLNEPGIGRRIDPRTDRTDGHRLAGDPFRHRRRRSPVRRRPRSGSRSRSPPDQGRRRPGRWSIWVHSRGRSAARVRRSRRRSCRSAPPRGGTSIRLASNDRSVSTGFESSVAVSSSEV